MFFDELPAAPSVEVIKFPDVQVLTDKAESLIEEDLGIGRKDQGESVVVNNEHAIDDVIDTLIRNYPDAGGSLVWIAASLTKKFCGAATSMDESMHGQFSAYPRMVEKIYAYAFEQFRGTHSEEGRDYFADAYARILMDRVFMEHPNLLSHKKIQDDEDGSLKAAVLFAIDEADVHVKSSSGFWDGLEGRGMGHWNSFMIANLAEDIEQRKRDALR